MAQPGEKFYIDARGVKAEGIVTETGFRVFKGSQVRDKIANYLTSTLKDLRKQSSADGTIENGILTRDIDFKSPSTAAYFLFGANASGPQTWKDENGMTMLEHDKLQSGVFKDPTDREYLGFLKTVEGKEIKRFYYLDMKKCLDDNEDRYDAIVPVPDDRRIKTDFDRKVLLDLSTKERTFHER